MAFNLKSLGSIVNNLSTAKELISSSTELVSTVKNSVSGSKEVADASAASTSGEMYPERIEKLIRMILADGEFGEDEMAMLERAATKEGLDPDEVVFVTKKRLKKAIKSTPQNLSPAQSLAYCLKELDVKFNSVIEAIRMGDAKEASSLLDTITGGVAGLAVSLGNKLFGKTVDDRVKDVMEMRDEQRAAAITATTLPSNELHVVELLEFVSAQVQAYENGDKGLFDITVGVVFGDTDASKEKQAWRALHQSSYNRAIMMVAGDPVKTHYINTLKPSKKLFGLF